MQCLDPLSGRIGAGVACREELSAAKAGLDVVGAGGEDGLVAASGGSAMTSRWVEKSEEDEEEDNEEDVADGVSSTGM